MTDERRGSEAPGDGETDAASHDIASLREARRAVGSHIYGQDEAIDDLFVGLMCGGHVLVEGAPGLGKTLLVRTVGQVCGLEFRRIQFTPDLMPSDVTGTTVLVHDDHGNARAEFQPGPVFAQMVLADEINRATPKSQSALLEAMQEGTVTVGGQVFELPKPFFVLATQNPIEMEGTYLLPEAQLDRFFMKLDIPYPTEAVLDDILEHTTGLPQVAPERILVPEDILRLQRWVREVPVASHVRNAISRFALATQPTGGEAPQDVRANVRLGVTPRGAQAVILAAKAHALLQGRFHVSFDDVRAVLRPTLRHRIRLSFEGESRDINVEALMDDVFDKVSKVAATA